MLLEMLWAYSFSATWNVFEKYLVICNIHVHWIFRLFDILTHHNLWNVDYFTRVTISPHYWGEYIQCKNWGWSLLKIYKYLTNIPRLNSNIHQKHFPFIWHKLDEFMNREYIMPRHMKLRPSWHTCVLTYSLYYQYAMNSIAFFSQKYIHIIVQSLQIYDKYLSSFSNFLWNIQRQ